MKGLGGSHRRVHPAVLEHHANMGDEFAVVGHRVEAKDSNGPLVGGSVPLQRFDGGGLSRPIRPEHGEYFAGGDFEAETINRHEIPVGHPQA